MCSLFVYAVNSFGQKTKLLGDDFKLARINGIIWLLKGEAKMINFGSESMNRDPRTLGIQLIPFASLLVKSNPNMGAKASILTTFQEGNMTPFVKDAISDLLQQLKTDLPRSYSDTVVQWIRAAKGAFPVLASVSVPGFPTSRPRSNAVLGRN